MRRFEIGLAAVALLVMLRLVIGLHFFNEGAKHYADPSWSSEGFIRAARGPFARFYHRVLEDFHGWNDIFYPLTHREKEDQPNGLPSEDWQQVAQERARQFLDRIAQDWEDFRGQFASHFGLTDEQKEQAKAALSRRKAELHLWFEEHAADLADHVHNWRRAQSAQAEPSSDDVPYEKRRIQEKQAVVRGQSNAWIGEIGKIERGYQQDLRRLLTDEQRETGDLRTAPPTLDRIDRVLTYTIWGVGALLLVGLFTRLAALVGALFLLSVVAAQPFWVADAQPTFNQFVEMFALLALAVLPTGRWAGLDYFIHHLFARRRQPSARLVT